MLPLRSLEIWHVTRVQPLSKLLIASSRTVINTRLLFVALTILIWLLCGLQALAKISPYDHLGLA